MTRLSRLVAFVVLFLGAPSPGSAQGPSPRDELLRHVPNDFGLCFVLNDLQGNAAKWDASDWIKSLKESALGQAFFNAPEFKDLLKFQHDLKKHLDIDWPALRDEVLGEAVVFAYLPGSTGQPDDEQGILLIHARRPEVLVGLLDKLNRAQKASGELKSLENRVHKGTKYICRLEPKESHYYVQSGPFFAYTAKEELLQRVLEQRQQESRRAFPLVENLKKAGADNAVACLLVNPRSFDADIKQKALGMAGPEALLLKAFLKHWNALDAVVLSLTTQDNLEFKLALLAREKDLPASARGLFMEAAQPSDLWNRFPDNAIFSMATRMAGSDVADAFTDFASPELRKAAQKTLQPLAALAGLDFARDVAPNVGPDWGFCVLPGEGPQKMPQVIAALAVRPGPKDIAMDHALYRGIHFFARLTLLDYNRRNPRDPIRLRTLKQEKVEIEYLANNKVFPPGFQPACALKDGYLLLATAPEAVARFRTAPATATVSSAMTTSEAPLLRISARELAKALREHRQIVIDQIAAKNALSKMAVAQGLDSALSVLDLVDRIEIARSGGSGQTCFVLRISPERGPREPRTK